MKKTFSILLLFCSVFSSFSQLNYNFTAVNGTYTAISGGSITSLIGGTVDQSLSATQNIGFTFQYDCVNYTQFKASSNGWMSFNTALAASSAGNNLNTGTSRPVLAPLWDDLATSNGGRVRYQVTGTTPNQICTIEWEKMSWDYFDFDDCISFQVKLYETSNRIEFVYTQGAAAIDFPSASIGLSGATSGIFLSLNNSGAAPTVSSVTETTTISTKPANGQIYRWDPSSTCSGTPTGGNASASPTAGCPGTPFTVSVSGSTNGCGLTYQWQSAATSAGPWSNIAGATGATYSSTISANTCYRRITTCTNGGASANSIDVCITASACYIMNTSTNVLSCPSSAGFYDTGGSAANYANGENNTITFTAPAGSCVSVTFNSFTSESGWDYLYIYNGPNTGSPLVGTYSGTQTIGTIISTGTSLTFRFTSDGFGNSAGWDAIISCNNSCSGTPNGGTASCNPTSSCPAGYVTSLTLAGSTTGCGISYQWQSAPAAGGPWTNIAGATALTSTTTVAATTFYQCITTCSNGGATATSSITSAAVTTGPANDNCTSAISITPGGACVTGDVSCATQSQAGCLGTADDDVWYSFVASQTSHDIQITAANTFNPVMQLFSGTCGALVSVTCNDATYTTGGSGCASVGGLTVGQTYYIRVYHFGATYPTNKTFSLCIGGVLAGACNLNYTGSTTPYSWTNGATLTNNINMGDDVLFAAKAPIGFNFCYDGFSYSDLYIASNSSLVFDAVGCNPNIQTTTYAAAGVATGYTIPSPAPINGTSVPRNAILGPWTDIEPLTSSATDDIRYGTLGTTPNRVFVVQFANIRMYDFSCDANTALNFYGQIKIFETSNTIEVHLQSKQVCTGWNNGRAILGLHNYNGTLANIPAGYNSPTQWTANSEAWRWTTTCTGCVVLPTGMAELKAEIVDDKSNVVRFKTTEDINIKHYIIERSRDGVNFNEVGKITAQGSQSNQYNLNDLIPERQTFYYRVTSVNTNNESSTSGLVVVERINQSGSTKVSAVYPNPTKDQLTLDLDIYQKGIVSIQLYDVFGKKVKEQNTMMNEGFNNINLSIGEMKAGMYFIKVFSRDNQLVHIEKIIKE